MFILIKRGNPELEREKGATVGDRAETLGRSKSRWD